MKKYILLLIIVNLALTSCEKDDFCVDPVTPNLIIRFYDNTSQTDVKSVERLSVWAQAKDTLTDYTSVTADSIAIPLDPINNQTIYNFKMNNIDGNLANNITDQLTITYDIEEVYVSRSCGFKVIFNNVSITSNNGWVISLTPTNDITINSESSAHVQIFH
ncbi:MAG: hypothetical protein JXQ93_09650 [Flavobacteriaceae bacterium]